LAATLLDPARLSPGAYFGDKLRGAQALADLLGGEVGAPTGTMVWFRTTLISS